MHFIQIEGLWQAYIEQVYRYHFSNSISSYISWSPLITLNSSNFLIIIIFVMVIGNLFITVILISKSNYFGMS